MEELGIKIDVVIQSPKGLQDLDSAITFYEGRINKLKEEMLKGRASKREERQKAIDSLRQDIKLVKGLLMKGVA